MSSDRQAGAKSISQGAGVRAWIGEKVGFGYWYEIPKHDWQIAADTARYIANSSKGETSVAVTHHPQFAQNLYPIDKANTDIATQDCVDLLNLVDAEARRYAKNV